MNPTKTLAALAVLLAGCAGMVTPIEERDIGLRRTSVFATVTPGSFTFADAPVSPARPGAPEPPTISHAVDEHLPITLGKNDCLECHDKPQNIGKPVAAGKARPAPASHYLEAAGTRKLSGKQYNCMSCHAPQADVPPLVRNGG